MLKKLMPEKPMKLETSMKTDILKTENTRNNSRRLKTTYTFASKAGAFYGIPTPIVIYNLMIFLRATYEPNDIYNMQKYA